MRRWKWRVIQTKSSCFTASWLECCTYRESPASLNKGQPRCICDSCRRAWRIWRFCSCLLEPDLSTWNYDESRIGQGRDTHPPHSWGISRNQTIQITRLPIFVPSRRPYPWTAEGYPFRILCGTSLCACKERTNTSCRTSSRWNEFVNDVLAKGFAIQCDFSSWPSGLFCWSGQKAVTFLLFLQFLPVELGTAMNSLATSGTIENLDAQTANTSSQTCSLQIWYKSNDMSSFVCP